MAGGFYATNVNASAHLLHGVMEVSWKNPSHPSFKEVVVLRKVNDFATSEVDPYATLVYRGTAQRVFDYSQSLPVTQDIKVAAKAILGTFNPKTNEFTGAITDSLNPESMYYYTVFAVDNSNNYYASLATTATGRVTENLEIAKKLYENLPTLYKIEDRETQLKRYMEIIGMGFNHMMTRIRNHPKKVDIDTCSPTELEAIANQLGWDLDKTLPVPSQRTSLKTAMEVYRAAGTKKGLDTLVKTNSGFPNTSGISESREYTFNSAYFGYYPFDLIRYADAGTPDFRPVGSGGDDFTLVGKGGDPLKYTMDFSASAKTQTDKFIVYVRKTTPLTTEQEAQLVKRLTKLVTRFAPLGTNFDVEIY